jgi:hypothetical protein
MIKQHLKGKSVKVYVDLKKIADVDDDQEEEDRDSDDDDGDGGGEVDGAIVTTNLFFYCYYKFLDNSYMSIYGHVYIFYVSYYIIIITSVTDIIITIIVVNTSTLKMMMNHDESSTYS